MEDFERIDKHHVDVENTKDSFDRAAAEYDSVTALQRDVGDRLLSRLDHVNFDPEVLVDVGAGTGVPTGKLIKRYPQTQILAVDIANGMLQVNRNRNRPGLAGCSVADMHNMPIKSDSVDMIFSNLAMQWSNDLPVVLDEYQRIMRNGGMLHFATFGPSTLLELKHAWEAVDVNNSHVNSFYSIGGVGDMLLEAGFVDVVVDSDKIKLHYPDVMPLMRELKTLGANNRTHGRSRVLTGKTKMQQMISKYEELREEDGIPVTYDIIYAHAWK